MKMFQKKTTLQALESAKNHLLETKQVLDTAVKAVSENNTRANRKAVRRAQMELEYANIRLDHIEVALAYQSENHDKTLRKPQVGEVVSRPTGIKKEVDKMVKTIEKDNAYKAESNRSMANAMEKYERQCIWAQEKADKAEAKRIKREARKAEQAKLCKAEAQLHAAADAAKKAEKEEARAEKLENEKTVALGYLPKDAKDLIEELKNLKTLISTIAERVSNLWDKKLELRNDGRAAKAKVVELSAGLKKPMCSAKVREAVAEQGRIEAEINAVSKERAALQKQGVSLTAERKALEKRISLLKKYSNPAVRTTIRSALADMRRAERRRIIDETIRKIDYIEERCKKDRFQIPSWNAETLQRQNGLDVLFKTASAYKASMKNSKETEKVFAASKEAIDKLKAMAEAKEPLKLDIKESRPSALQNNMLSMCMRIDCEAKGVRTEWISVEHTFVTSLTPSWKLFSSNKKEGLELLDEFKDSIMVLLDKIEVLNYAKAEKILYRGLYSSASHQKGEKLISCKDELMALHEELVWFGLDEATVRKTCTTGAEIWKMRANLARPIAFAIKLKDGRSVYLHNIMMVPDPAKKYHIKNGLFIGKNKGNKPYEFREDDVDVLMGDGEALAVMELMRNAFQGGGTGVKMMCANGKESLAFAEKKRGKKADIPEDKYIVCGNGCFKFDKLYPDGFDSFAKHMDELAERYPGINLVYALRESEELEEEDKIRRVSRSLLQQLIIAGDEEMHEIVEPTVNSLRYKKTAEGVFASLAELGIPEEKRSAFAKLVFDCPELITNPIVQKIAERSWESKKNDAMGNKFRTEGQYPYILQDPVALWEVWVLGADPDDPNLGVLKAGEVSVVGVPAGKKMVAIRYPANFFTAKTVVCVPMKEIFGECGNVAILSVHDDILIIQDGDVDGDEMGFFYNEKLVELVERMIRVVKPPVVIFEHGKKDVPEVIGTHEALVKRMYSTLRAAKEFDSVGKYANLARDCAYLARIALRLGKKAKDAGDIAEAAKQDELYRNYILWMAAASTGAILAIDQVKGVVVDPALITWLDKITEEVHKVMVKTIVEEDDFGNEVIRAKYASPYTQPFVKNDMTIDTLMPNTLVQTDELAVFVDKTVGNWEVDDKEFRENNEKLCQLILDDRHKSAPVRQAVLTSGILTELKANYFNRKVKNGEKSYYADEAIMKLIAAKKPVGLKDLMLMYWRNMCTLEFRMQEKTVVGRKAAYYKMVHDSLISWALSTKWFASSEFKTNYEFGHEFTDEEKLTNLVNRSIIDALQLDGKDNKVSADMKASYAKFVLNVFANEIRDNVIRNRSKVDIRYFMIDNIVYVPCDSIECEETDYDALVDYEEEYQYYPDYRLTDEELIAMMLPEAEDFCEAC